MDDFHLLEDGGAIVGDEDLAFGVLDLKACYFELRKYGLTILSMPRGPRLVRTTSATASESE